MDSINSWINEDEVRKLADDLSSSPEAVKDWRANNFDGFAIPEKQGEVAKQVGGKSEVAGSEIADEVRESKSSSLAGASAMAASAGLLNAKKSEVKLVEEVKEVKDTSDSLAAVIAADKVVDPKVTVKVDAEEKSPSCDHYLEAVPVSVNEKVTVDLPEVHSSKGVGTFERIDQQLSKTVKANGICVIDRDGDVLYSSLKNQGLVAFTIETMMGSSLMKIGEGEFGNIRVKISSGEYLEFVSVMSTRGVLVLATSMSHILGRGNAKFVAGDIVKIANMA